MKRGIYVVCNDVAQEHAIALVNSIRHYDADTPIGLIPFDDNYQKLHEVASSLFDTVLYDEAKTIDRIVTNTLPKEITDTRHRGTLRKFACWFGPYDEFLYFDTDIIVFEKVADMMNYLVEYDFLSCDYQFRSGLESTLNRKIVEDGEVRKEYENDVFNAGFFGSKKDLISLKQLEAYFTHAANHLDYFPHDFTDQAMLNHYMLKYVPRRINLARNQNDREPGSWAGMDHFVEGPPHRLHDPKNNKLLRYLHWAGVPCGPGKPYWEIWKYYRTLYPSIPFDQNKAFSKPSFWQNLRQKAYFRKAA